MNQFESAPLDRARSARPSRALWIPLIWLFIAGSRPLSAWFNRGAGDLSDRNYDGSPVDRAIFIALIVMALVVLISRRRKLAALLRENIPILIFLIYCCLSISWSDFPDIAFKRWVRAIGDLSMVLVVLTDASPSAAVKRLFAQLGFMLIPLSILFDTWRGRAGLGYHFGLTQNKNMFGAISMILGLAAVWRYLVVLREKGSKGRAKALMSYACLILMSIWCVWTAGSTTALVCFLLGSALLIMSRWSLVRRPMVLHLIIATAVFLAVYAAILNPHLGVVEAMGKDPTLTGRTDVWQAVIQLVPNRLLGAGFESYWLGSRLKELRSIFPWEINEAHNGYIEIYLNLGWAGATLLAIVVLAGYRKIFAGLRQNSSVITLYLAYLVVAVVYNLSEAGFRIFHPVGIVCFLSIVGAASEAQRENSRAAVTDPWLDSDVLVADSRTAAAISGDHL